MRKVYYILIIKNIGKFIQKSILILIKYEYIRMIDKKL